MKTQLHILLILISNLVIGQKFIAQYEFNGNAKDKKGVLNASVYGATLVSDREGIRKSAYQFDGKDDYLEISSGLLNIEDKGSFSVEFFAYLQKTEGEWRDFFGVSHPYSGGSIFSFYACPASTNPNDPDMFKIEYDNEGKISIAHRTKSGINETIEINLGQSLFDVYHHFVIVRDGKKSKLNVFFDGELLSEMTLTSVEGLKSFPAYIGKHKPCMYDQFNAPNQTDALFLKGKLDYFRIYNLALNAKQVKRQFLKEKIRLSCNSTNDNYFDDLDEQIEESDYQYYLNSIKIYPNPSNGRINIDVPNQFNIKSLICSNSYGQVVYRSGFQSSINLNCVPPGIYFLSLVTDKKIHTYRIVIQR